MITNVVDHDLRQSSGDLFHSQRVGELVIAVVKELRDPLHVPRPKQDQIDEGHAVYSVLAEELRMMPVVRIVVLRDAGRLEGCNRAPRGW
jgi:hypothetical protein